jgi:outer membrane protein assembly factor BamB
MNMNTGAIAHRPGLLAAFLYAALSGVAALGGETAEWLPSGEKGWPQFRGPHRNGISAEKNLLQSWPEAGPPVLWSATNLGSGYSSPIIAADSIFITGDVVNELHIFALDLSGNLRWTATNGAAWRGPYPGARASCTYAGGRLYHLNSQGHLTCFDAGTGQTVWSVNTVEEFEGRVPTWGISECVLIDGDRVIVTPGGRKAAMAALDRNTGKTIWKTAALEPAAGASSKVEGPAYASPILIRVAGQSQVVGVTARHFIGVAADTGKLLWTFAFPTQYEVLGSSPVLCAGGVFVTGPDGGGGKWLRFVPGEKGLTVEPGWGSTLDTCHGGIVELDGFLYGSWYRATPGWGCVNVQDGTVPYRDRTLAMGSVLYADGHLYILAQGGTMALVKPDPTRWDVVSRFEFVRERKNDVWAHPVVLNGRLYLRHQDTLKCFDVARPLAEAN